MPKRRLTAKGIDALQATGERTDYWDDLLPGLHLRVSGKTGRKVWFVRYRAGGRQRRLKLGAYPVIGLAEARDLGREAMAAAVQLNRTGPRTGRRRGGPSLFFAEWGDPTVYCIYDTEWDTVECEGIYCERAFYAPPVGPTTAALGSTGTTTIAKDGGGGLHGAWTCSGSVECTLYIGYEDQAYTCDEGEGEGCVEFEEGECGGGGGGGPPPPPPPPSCDPSQDPDCYAPLRPQDIEVINTAITKLRPLNQFTDSIARAVCEEAATRLNEILQAGIVMRGSSESPLHYGQTYQDTVHIDQSVLDSTYVNPTYNPPANLLQLLTHEALHTIRNPDGTFRYWHPQTPDPGSSPPYPFPFYITSPDPLGAPNTCAKYP